MFDGITVDHENDEPNIDEGWWDSILSDEEIYQNSDDELLGNIITHYAIIDWHKVQNIFNKDEIVRLEVSGFNRGGLLVEGEGIHGFVPVSHLIEVQSILDEIQRKDRLSGYMGQSLRLKIIECKPELDRIVFSERAALAAEGQRNELFQYLEPGIIVKGKVTNITKFGVFVDLGGVEGLIHVSELSWGRVQHPDEIVGIGEGLETKVLQVNEDCVRVALSLKQLYPNPWETLDESYKTGDQVSAVISSLTGYGAFAQLKEGIEGLIHISSIKSKYSGAEIESLLIPGQSVLVEILNIDIEKRRLGLGLLNIE